ncbi:hypothetical protein ES703_52928 [subsurface metagenome]
MKARKKSSIDRVLSSIQIQTQRRTKRELLDWIAYHKIHIQAGTRVIPFSLDDHEYLREIYEDQHPHQVFRKAAQMCISVKHVLEALWMCDQFSLKVLYYFPTDGDVEKFGDDRLTPIIKHTPYLDSRVQEAKEEGGVYNKGLKHIGSSSIYMRGMVTRRAVKTVDADFLILDELDECDQRNLEYAYDRVMHSPLQWKRELSQPSLTGFGIDRSFEESDQKFWMLKCPACGEYNCLEENFPQNFMRVSSKITERTGQKYYRGCLKCAAPLDMSAGEWVAEYPGRDKRGYQVSQCYTQICPQGVADPADQIMREYHSARKPRQKERFQNSRRGYSYGGERQPITNKVLDACEAEYRMGPDAGLPTGIGIDVGDTKHIFVRGHNPITDKPRILWIESFDEWTRAAEIIRMFGEPPFVVDALPYKDSATTLVRIFPNKGYIQYFKEHEVLKEEGEGKKKVDVIHVDRTESLDITTGEFVECGIEIPSMRLHDGPQLIAITEFRKHMKNLVSDIIERPNGAKVRIFKTNVDNHYGMAANSARIAEEYGPKAQFSGTLPVFGKYN